jgi:exoribonuclease R
VQNTLRRSEETDALTYVRLRIAAEDLEKQAKETYFRVYEDPSASNVYRILDVNPSLGVVVISGGMDRKIRNGLTWVAETDGPGRVVLKTVVVRTFVSAAVVTEGEFANLVPGMHVTPGFQK